MRQEGGRAAAAMMAPAARITPHPPSPPLPPSPVTRISHTLMRTAHGKRRPVEQLAVRAPGKEKRAVRAARWAFGWYEQQGAARAAWWALKRQ